MKLLVANNAAPFVRGGAELLADRLVQELRKAGHEAELLRLPLGDTPEEIVDGIIAAATLQAVNVDRIIGLKFPAYLLPHDDVVVWLVHQFRQVYDLAPESGGWPSDPRLDEVRALIHSADGAAFAQARRLYAISPVVADRLRRYNGLEAEVLLTPPHADHPYRCEPAEPYIAALGRISNGKRQALVVEAMAYAGPDARLIVAGPPDTPDVLEALEQAIDEAGARGRVEVIPRFISDEEKLSLMARCTASIYLPIDEDSYGYVCYEAAMSSKPTITGTDAGGARTLVAHGVSGLVVDPQPAELGTAIDRMLADPRRAAEMGRSARLMAEKLDLSWERVVEELTR